MVGHVGAEGDAEEIVTRLNAAAVEALNDPSVRKQLENLGLQMPPKDKLTPEALGAWQKAEIAKWWPMIAGRQRQGGLNWFFPCLRFRTSFNSASCRRSRCASRND